MNNKNSLLCVRLSDVFVRMMIDLSIIVFRENKQNKIVSWDAQLKTTSKFCFAMGEEDTLVFPDEIKWWHPTEDRFFIHDNGRRPFVVKVISPSEVKIYKERSNRVYEQLHHFTHLRRIFIGESPENGTTQWSGSHGNKYRGNNILLEIGEHVNRYIVISFSIFEFESKAPIVSFVSPVGSSDVPYPHAIDENGRFYLLWNCVVLENVPEEHRDDPSFYFCHSYRKEASMRIGPIDSEEPYLWYFRCNVDPGQDEKQFNRWCRVRRVFEVGRLIPDAWPPETMYVKDQDGAWIACDLPKYIELQNEWRQRLQCSTLPTTTLTARFF
jgi:hypothetical protein